MKLKAYVYGKPLLSVALHVREGGREHMNPDPSYRAYERNLVSIDCTIFNLKALDHFLQRTEGRLHDQRGIHGAMLSSRHI